ncbi:MAG: ABC transporter ATP-binding protein, partial [Coraliomargarita sp.]
LERNGQVREYVGGCDEWLDQRQTSQAKPAPKKTTQAEPKTETPNKARKLSNKEREALKTLPGKIEQLETAHAELSAKMATAEYYQDSANDPAKDAQTLEQLEAETLEAYEHWEAIEALANA